MLKRLICLASVFAILCLSIISVGAESTGVTFYTDINYSKNPVTLSEGRYNLAQLNAAGIRNDDISSIQIPNGYIVIVYEHENFGGKYWIFISNTPNMVNYGCNDIMSSVVIYKCPEMKVLGTLGGTWAKTSVINEKGQVAGESYIAGASEKHAFIWDTGTMKDLGTLGGYSSGVVDINENGQVVGDSYTGNSGEHAFIWENGVMKDLGTLGGTSSHAVAINEKGQVVGYSETRENVKHAFIWENGLMKDLGTLGGTYSHAKAINEKGQVVGHSYLARDSGEHAFIWENGVMKDLGDLGGNFSYAKDINEEGQVVGFSYNVKGEYHAFIWKNGLMNDLGTLGGKDSKAVAINEKGQVVGNSYTENNEYHPFIWENGVMKDLGTSVASYSDVYDINEKGQVVGDLNLGQAVIWEDASGGVKIQMFNGTTTGTTNVLNPKLKLINTGTTAVNLSNVTIRYYYTIDGERTQNFYCDWATVGNNNITSKFVKMTTAKTGADYYLEIGFTSSAGTLQPGASTEIQTRFAKSDWTNYTQTGDYSFNSSATGYVDWNKTTAYINGSLKFGFEP